MPTVHAVAVAWYTPMGQVGGTVSWTDYRYATAQAGTVRNFPSPLDAPGDLFNSAVAMAGNASNQYHQQVRVLAFRDLSLMRSAGFDNLLYDMLPSPNWAPGKTLSRPSVVTDPVNAEPLLGFIAYQQYVAAAEQVGMTVAPLADIRNASADYPGGYNLNVTEWTNVLNGVLDNIPVSPAVYRIGGVPVVVHFGSDKNAGSPPDVAALTQDGGWRQVLKNVRGSGRSIYFVADYRPNISTPLVNQDFVNDPDPNGRASAVYMFSPAGTDLFMSAYQSTQVATFSVPRWWTVSSGYYNAAQTYTQTNFKRIHDTYLAAIRNRVEHMVVLTWNDFGEDTDIVPSPAKGRCMLDVFSFYNTWFKTGREPEPQDKLFVAYPVREPSSVVTPATNFGSFGVSPAFSPMQLHYWASLRSPAVVVLPSGARATLPSGTSAGTLGAISAGRQFIAVNGVARELPFVSSTGTESQRAGSGGLEHRCVDLSFLVQSPAR